MEREKEREKEGLCVTVCVRVGEGGRGERDAQRTRSQGAGEVPEGKEEDRARLLWFLVSGCVCRFSVSVSVICAYI